MANSGTTFAKRQKERARQERQAEKLQRRLERKRRQEENPTEPRELVITYDENGQPEGFDFNDF